MAIRIQKCGNNLGVRIPQKIANKAGLVDGVEVQIGIENGTIMIKKAEEKPSLEELVAKITEENKHKEIGFGIMGRELI